jgi:antirestriction protein ArdC
VEFKKMFNKKSYEIITEKILEKLEQGLIPWQQPFKNGKPKNFISKKAYSGINFFMLSMQYSNCPYFATFKQIQDIGGKIKKGAKGTPIIFWKKLDNENSVGEDSKNIFVLKQYTVFNLEQTENVEFEIDTNEPNFNPIENCENIYKNMPNAPKLKHEKNQPFYSPSDDFVNMSKPENFLSNDKYYATLFHELIHSTGHISRLNRENLVKKNRFGSRAYGLEELTAEMGAAFLCAETGISSENIDNSIAYIQSWIQTIKEKPSILFQSASEAQKASDFILNKKEVKTND